MTETTTAETTIDQAAEAPPAAETTDEPQGKVGREAAKYRTQLREAEAERDTLRDRLTTMQRGEAERLSGLAKGSALWATGTTVDDLLDDDGNLDPQKVTEAAQRARDELGAAEAPRTPKPDPSQGIGDAAPGGSFAAAFGPSAHR